MQTTLHPPDIHDTQLAELAAQGLDATLIGWRDDGSRASARQLASIVAWSRAWQRHGGDRAALRRAGCELPPVEPGCDPDQDWLTFSRWIARLPLTWRYADLFGVPPPVTTLSDAQLDEALAEIEGRLAERGIELALAADLPDRLRYQWLHAYLTAEALEFLAPGATLVIDGCEGDCEPCFQRRWCDLALTEYAQGVAHPDGTAYHGRIA